MSAASQLPVVFDAVFDAPQGSVRIFNVGAHAVQEPPANGLWSRLNNDDKAGQIRELTREGKTTAQIAVRLETTTSAVRSVAFRESIRLNGPPISVQQPKGSPPEVPDRKVPPAAWMPLAGALPAAMEDATGCMWPVGAEGGRAQMFCNCKKVRGRSYCAEHFTMSRK